MTLAVILAPLLALCVVARGIGFLPALGVVTAVAMLVERQEPLQEFGAVCVLLFSVLPVWFVSRYQDDGARERSGPAVPFLALGLMIILQLATGTPAALGEASGHANAAYLPAGLCVALAGLVAVTYRQAMVWQWAGLLVCVDGVMLSGVIENQMMVVGVTALAGCVVALLGGMCVHRIMLRVEVAPVQKGTGAERPSARSGGFEPGNSDDTGPEADELGPYGAGPSGLGPETIVAPRIWADAEAAVENAAEDKDALPHPARPEQDSALPDAEPEPPAKAMTDPETAQKEQMRHDAEVAFSGVAAQEGAESPEQEVDADPDIPPPALTEDKTLGADLAEAERSEEGPSGQTPAAAPLAAEPEEPEDMITPAPSGHETGQPSPAPEAPVRRTPEMIARDVWLRGYRAERGEDV